MIKGHNSLPGCILCHFICSILYIYVVNILFQVSSFVRSWVVFSLQLLWSLNLCISFRQQTTFCTYVTFYLYSMFQLSPMYKGRWSLDETRSTPLLCYMEAVLRLSSCTMKQVLTPLHVGDLVPRLVWCFDTSKTDILQIIKKCTRNNCRLKKSMSIGMNMEGNKVFKGIIIGWHSIHMKKGTFNNTLSLRHKFQLQQQFQQELYMPPWLQGRP